MCQPITFEALRAIYSELKTIGDYDQELLAAMQEKLVAERWGCLCKLIWAVPEPTPVIFTDILCELLDNHRHIEIMEAIADGMFSLKDPRAVRSLIGVLDHYLIGDPDCHFNRKIIYALGNVGSPEAIDGIRTALDSPEEIIRATATKELARLESSRSNPS